MKRSYMHKIVFMGLIISTQLAFGQLDAPKVEAVYGGLINDIAGIPLSVDTSRIFIATESANSLFYADIYSNTTSPVYGAFSVVPGVDAAAGYGSGIQKIAAHESSGLVFFLHNNTIYSADPNTGAVTSVVPGMNIPALEILDDRMLFVDGTDLHFGDLSPAGVGTPHVDSPIASMIT